MTTEMTQPTPTVEELAQFVEILLAVADSCLFFPADCKNVENPTIEEIHGHIYGGTNGCSRCRMMARDKIQLAELREREIAEEEFDHKFDVRAANAEDYFAFLRDVKFGSDNEPT